MWETVILVVRYYFGIFNKKFRVLTAVLHGNRHFSQRAADSRVSIRVQKRTGSVRCFFAVSTKNDERKQLLKSTGRAHIISLNVSGNHATERRW